MPRARDLGGFEVRRALPVGAQADGGPFIFFDQMGPAEFLIGHGIDVRPHPHIGLATVTYLFEGEVLHRDSLGTSAPIRPGEVNLMTAGRGIVHSERETSEANSSPRATVWPASRARRRARRQHRLFGIQAWAALPKIARGAGARLRPPRRRRAAAHHRRGQARAPGDGQRLRRALARRVSARRLFAEAVLAPGAVLPLDPDYDERAVYVASGEIDIAGDTFGEGRLLVFKPGDRISILATAQSRLVLLGGEPMDGPRHIWWNFVSSSKERIEQAKEDWRAKRFALVPGDEKEFIPLPE